MKPENSLDQSELIRYKRQLQLEDDYGFDQLKLKASTVFIAGAGGLGSPVSFYLAAAGVGRIVICDNDYVELSNLNRQILHSVSGLGRSKAGSAKSRLSELNPGIEIEGIKAEIKSRPDELIDGADLIIDCLDNIEARYHLNEYSIRKQIPIVHGGINGFAGQISFLFPPETPCLRCIFPDPFEAGIPVPVIGSAAGIIGSMQAMEAVKYLCGCGDLLKNRLQIIDGYTWEIESIKIRRNPGCPACGNL